MADTMDAQAVLTLAHAQGHAWVDSETAARIAAAATAAVQAVAASAPGVEPVLFEASSAEFLAMLDALAEPQS